ncbi:hypothetical protein IQ06DRAFT_152156 [Phaeosphaeriaceae sp. SRC1lsM3a]|nr:hypothetical protein IQ06DRAFT_152156 [Stagonospora sp. SRC1lsM3a]
MGVQSLHFDFAELDTEPEVVVLLKLRLTFGPQPAGLIEHISNANAGGILAELWQAVKQNDVIGDFADWTEDVSPAPTDEAIRLILRITNFDPAKREPMSDIVKGVY